MNRAERMTSVLTQQLNPSRLELADDSAKHAGHAGAQPGGETHYCLVIESSMFTGMSKVRRHQIIYQLLADEFKSGLHALSIEAVAPGEP
jgi:BolA family transcriptional regulator, general stress-responsive regulator